MAGPALTEKSSKEAVLRIRIVEGVFWASESGSRNLKYQKPGFFFFFFFSFFIHFQRLPRSNDRMENTTIYILISSIRIVIF